MKKVLLSFLFTLAVFSLAACDSEEDTVDLDVSQGVTEDTITVGNAAGTSGQFADVGQPFNSAIRSYFEMVNNDGGIAGARSRPWTTLTRSHKGSCVGSNDDLTLIRSVVSHFRISPHRSAKYRYIVTTDRIRSPLPRGSNSSVAGRRDRPERARSETGRGRQPARAGRWPSRSPGRPAS